MPQQQSKGYQYCSFITQATFTIGELVSFIVIQLRTSQDNKVDSEWQTASGQNQSINASSNPVITDVEDFWKIVNMCRWAEGVLVVIAILQLFIAVVNLYTTHSSGSMTGSDEHPSPKKISGLVTCFNCITCLLNIGSYITLIIALIWGIQFYNKVLPYESTYPNLVQRMREQFILCAVFICLALVPLVLAILMCICGMGVACCACCVMLFGAAASNGADEEAPASGSPETRPLNRTEPAQL